MAKTSKVSLVDEIYQRVRNKILKGIYLPGTRLIEAELVEEYKVSRVTVRDALRRLAAEDMVELLPNKGIKVRQITRKEFHDTMVVRAQLEGLAAKLAAENASADLRSLIRIHDQERELLSKTEWDFNDGTRKNELNQLFHGTVAVLSENSSLQKLLSQLAAQTHVYQYHFLRSTPRSLFIESFMCHDDILTAIQQHRAEEAFQISYAHVLNGEKFADYYFSSNL